MLPEYWENVISTYSDFARRKNLTFHIIKSNPRKILDNRRVEHDYHKRLQNSNLWGKLQHSLAMISLTAPLSVGRFDRILFSSQDDPTKKYMKTVVSRPATDEKIVWADLQVKHEGFITRYDKIAAIKEHIESGSLMIRSCNNHKLAGNRLNCSACGMCYETIVPFVQVGADPNRYGFQVDHSTFKKIRKWFENKKAGGWNYLWDRARRSIPEMVDWDLYGSKEFFEWFKKAENIKTLSRARARGEWKYLHFYNRLPYSLAKYVDKFYSIVDINIHKHNPTSPDSQLPDDAVRQ
jgi:hypothetical protein